MAFVIDTTSCSCSGLLKVSQVLSCRSQTARESSPCQLSSSLRARVSGNAFWPTSSKPSGIDIGPSLPCPQAEVDHHDYETDELLVNLCEEASVSASSHPEAFEVFTEYKFWYFFREEAKRSFLQCCRRFRLALFG